jgi:two-component system, NarL family, invasion response regulator UvrY
MKLEHKIPVAIADSHPLMRQGIKNIINASEDFEVVIEANDGPELINLMHSARHLPAICILDTDMRHLNTLSDLKKQWPPIKTLIFSLFHSEFIIHEMVSNGANGYLEKTCTNARLLQALTCIYHSNYYFTDGVARRVFDMHKRHIMPRITSREIEFLYHCCSELNYKEISERMDVSVRTVENYRDALFSKFGIKTRTGLVLFALQNGIVPLDAPVAMN